MVFKNKFLSLSLAALAGIVFPTCECGIIPIVKRLIKKGVPLNLAVTYMLAAPLINPVVIFSTFLAFQNTLEVVFERSILGFIIAVLTGYLVSFLRTEGILKSNPFFSDLDQLKALPYSVPLTLKLKDTLVHAATDFFDLGKYLIIGSLVAAVSQTFLSRQMLLTIGDNLAPSILVMMVLAVILSLCSEVDAFIASTFIHFPLASKLAFLVLGPMLDLKLLLLFLGIFKKRFIFFLVAWICGLVFLLTLILGKLIG